MFTRSHFSLKLPTYVETILTKQLHDLIMTKLCQTPGDRLYFLWKLIFKITQEPTNAYELMTNRQVKTQKCDFLFILTSLNNDDQPCAHKLKKLEILGGIVGEKLIAQN